jgi:xylan 1,4-beta-xylosidase
MIMRRPDRIVALSALLSLNNAVATARMAFPDCVNGPEALTKNLVCDPTAKPAERAAALIKAWNVTEKITNLVE